ncbi:MAG: DUF4340 domain-containing protein [Panacagrimonas sp.]
MKRIHLNLLLLVVVAGLGAAVWLSQKKDEKGPPLTSLKRDAITRIALEHPDRPVIKLEKKDGKWWLTEPVQAETDSFEINGILGVAELEVKAKLDAGASKAELELEPPKYTVTLDDTKIALGGSEPIKFRRYVLVGDVLGLVDDPPSAALDADYSDLVAKAVVPEGAELAKIELPGLALEKNAEGVWTSPQQGEARPAQVTRLAESWKNARAMWNAAEPEAAAKPSEPAKADRVQLTLADGRVIDLVVAERDPQLVLARKELGVRYTLSKALVDELFRIPAEPKPEPAAEPAKDGEAKEAAPPKTEEKKPDPAG